MGGRYYDMDENKLNMCAVNENGDPPQSIFPVEVAQNDIGTG